VAAIPVARRDARERALELLYEAEAKTQSIADILAALPLAPDPFTVDLVRGVAAHQVEHDALIVEYARGGWALDRMPIIDRIVLRLGIEELGHQRDVPTAVVLDEAVRLAKAFSTDDSGRFVNGMLANMARTLRGETAQPSPLASVVDDLPVIELAEGEEVPTMALTDEPPTSLDLFDE
jgi:transcription antitermination protein NusB